MGWKHLIPSDISRHLRASAIRRSFSLTAEFGPCLNRTIV